MATTNHTAGMGSGKLSDGDSVHSWRDALPASMISKSEMSVWSVLKKCMGKVRSVRFTTSFVFFFSDDNKDISSCAEIRML